MSLHAVPITLREASAFVDNFHRHNVAPRGGLFAIGCSDGAALVGVAIIGRPVARMLDDGETSEVIRVCVLDDAPKGACSRAWLASKAMGYRRTVNIDQCAYLRAALLEFLHLPRTWDEVLAQFPSEHHVGEVLTVIEDEGVVLYLHGDGGLYQSAAQFDADTLALAKVAA